MEDTRGSKDQGMLDAIGYVCVSTNEQADHDVSLDAQYESLMSYALLQKLNLVEVIAIKLDRLFRDAADALA